MSNYLKRGNMLWESSRMFLPEHKEALMQRKEEKRKVSKPILDEQELAVMDETICEAMEFTYILDVTYFHNGLFESCTGYINFYDQNNHVLWLRNHDKVTRVKVADITEIKKIRSLT